MNNSNVGCLFWFAFIFLILGSGFTLGWGVTFLTSGLICLIMFIIAVYKGA